MAAKGRTELDVGADGVAVITIYNPPVNSLSIDGMVLLSTPSSKICFLLLYFSYAFPVDARLGFEARGWSN